MTVEEQYAMARVLLDALTALDPEDRAASLRAVPLALAPLAELGPSEGADPTPPVAYGALTLANACVALVAEVKGVDRLDVIAALRTLFPAEPGARDTDAA